MNVGGLFSGIGGWELGLERAGMQVLWHCESDPYCQRVLAYHWPGVPCYPDVSELWGADVAPVDLLCGGFPCQDLSAAGKGAGLDGARSGLWSEFARLIGELRPRYVVVENVPALRSRGLGRVLGEMATLGYDAEWDCIPAQAVGAPHRRDRVWIVAYPSRDAEARSASPARAIGERAWASGQSADVADTQVVTIRPGFRADEPGGQRRGRLGDGGGSRAAADVENAEGVRSGSRWSLGERRDLPDWPGRAGWEWEPEPDVGRVADGVPARVDRLSALGNALIPQIAEWLGRRILAYEEGLGA